jgi:hypothetical protein
VVVVVLVVVTTVVEVVVVVGPPSIVAGTHSSRTLSTPSVSGRIWLLVATNIARRPGAFSR